MESPADLPRQLPKYITKFLFCCHTFDISSSFLAICLTFYWLYMLICQSASYPVLYRQMSNELVIQLAWPNHTVLWFMPYSSMHSKPKLDFTWKFGCIAISCGPASSLGLETIRRPSKICISPRAKRECSMRTTWTGALSASSITATWPSTKAFNNGESWYTTLPSRKPRQICRNTQIRYSEW